MIEHGNVTSLKRQEVDAGGMGVLYILIGASHALDGTLDIGLMPISKKMPI